MRSHPLAGVSPCRCWICGWTASPWLSVGSLVPSTCSSLFPCGIVHNFPTVCNPWFHFLIFWCYSIVWNCDCRLLAFSGSSLPLFCVFLPVFLLPLFLAVYVRSFIFECFSMDGNPAPDPPLCSALSDRALKKTFQSVLCGKNPYVVTRPRPADSSSFQNHPAVVFFDDEVEALAAPYQRMLVGKFGRVPKLISWGLIILWLKP